MVGVVLWEVIEIQKPYFEITSNQEVADGVVNGTLKIPKPKNLKIPKLLEEIMFSCFKKMEHRPSFQVELGLNSLTKNCRRFTSKFRNL